MEAESRNNGEPVKISNSLQQQIYEEEKRKVWDLQWKALSNSVPPELRPEDEHDAPAPTPMGFAPRFNRNDHRRGQSRGTSMAATPAMDSPRDRSPSAFSADGESTYTGNVNTNKVLRIKRTVSVPLLRFRTIAKGTSTDVFQKNGKTVTQIVRDPAVVNQYLKRVEEKKLEYYINNPMLLEEMQSTGNAEEDEIRREAYVAHRD